MSEFDYRKLRGRIVEKFGTFQSFSAAMGWSDRTCSLKINNKLYWKQPEIKKAVELLELEMEDIPVYFFTILVQ